MYSTTFGSLNSQLGGGISTEMQCDGPAELSREHICRVASRANRYKTQISLWARILEKRWERYWTSFE